MAIHGDSGVKLIFPFGHADTVASGLGPVFVDRTTAATALLHGVSRAAVWRAFSADVIHLPLQTHSVERFKRQI